MRRSALILVALTALMACSPKKPPNAPAPSAAIAPAPVATTQAPPDAQTASAPVPAPAPAPAPAQVSVEGPPIRYGAAPAEAEVRFSPSDYASRERRITALINNAESRDTSGETQYIAQKGRTERQHCASRACIEHAYAAEEAQLRKWEGSGDIR